MVQCARCGEDFVPNTEGQMLEGLCMRCLFDPKRTRVYINEAFSER